MRSQHFRGNVFVANLPPEFSDDQLAETFDSFGIVLSASVARDPATGKRLRYGFVDIATANHLGWLPGRSVRLIGCRRERAAMGTRSPTASARARSRGDSRPFRWNAARCRAGLVKLPR